VKSLTKNEKLLLYGLAKYPQLNDGQLSKKLRLKHSTVTSIRRRLRESGYFRIMKVPMLQNLGCEMLVVIYTNFNPVIPLEERIKVTKKTIEVFEEIFFSAGEQEKGFSLSMAKNYAQIGKINDIRTETFGKLNLLDGEYPREVVFPFEISKIPRFLDFSHALKNHFGIEEKDEKMEENYFEICEREHLSNMEKNVYWGLIKYPDLSDKAMAEKLSISRTTVSRLRKRFEGKKLMKKMIMPNLKKLGFEILAFYHIKLNPAIDMENMENRILNSDSVIFMARRKFEIVLLSIYANYDEYKADKTKKMQFLKENGVIAENPLIRTYSLNKMAVIKDFDFAPIVKKLLIEK
jgi:DNA-binding Lrp family transcriptional regulator